MRLAIAAACATGCLSTPPAPRPACTLRMLDELVTPGGTFTSPWLARDSRSIYFVSDPLEGPGGIAYATRATADDRFGAPILRDDLVLPPNNTPDRITLSPDELEIWIFTSSPTFYASRASASDRFPAPAQLQDGGASLSVTGDALTGFYTRGDGQIRVATRTSRSGTFAFGGETFVAGIEDCSQQVDSCATDPTGANLYCAISSVNDPNRVDRIWHATNNALAPYTASAFYSLAIDTDIAPQPGADDSDPMIDADDHTLVFASQRSPATSNDAYPWIYCN